VIERATPADLARLAAAFGGDDLAAIAPHVRARRLARGAYFLEAGEPAIWCGTVGDGVLREYYPLADGREVTRGFAGPGDYVGSLSDLLLGQPSRSAVVAERDARVVEFPWRLLREAARTRPAWAAHVARIVERTYLRKAEREYELLALDAVARYARFRDRYAALEPLIPLRHVASYIGVTPEHLSRLRRSLDPARAARPARSRSGSRSSATDSPPARPTRAPRRATRPARPSRP
jgi:CRP-like cAMP-binding protein